jgi:glycosyltransferase involved in cell wall biosynthesis
MKTLMTADAVGGVFTYALELADGLAHEGIQTVLALTGPEPDQARRERLARSRLAGVEERRFALEWAAEPWNDVDRTAGWLLELIDEHRPDLVHLNSFALGAVALGPPKLVVGHSCVLSWHEAVRRRAVGPEWDRYRDAVAAGIAGADLLVAPTGALLAELRRLYGAAPRGSVISNGVAATDFRPLPDQRYVLGVGRAWDEAKNLAALERVAPDLDAPVVLAGEGTARGPVSHEELRLLYGHATVFAEPARYEPFGLAALEAGLSGCALVLGDIPSLREVWGETAVYVDPFDDRALAKALIDLLADDQRRKRLGREARRRALSYSRARMTRAYAEVYRRLVAEARLEAA